MKRITSTPHEAQISSYKVANLIIKNMQLHNLAENLIIPACKEIIKSMFSDSSMKEVPRIPFSDCTISRQIDGVFIHTKTHY